jgi:hypothetical protein
VIRLPRGKTGARTIIAGDDVRQCLSRIASKQLALLEAKLTQEEKLKRLQKELEQQINVAIDNATNGVGEFNIIEAKIEGSESRPHESINHFDLYKKFIGLDAPLFILSNGEFPKDLPGAFERALEQAGLLYNAQGQKRSLYSIRHTYATIMLVQSKVDIHTLARNMGTSVQMIEKHYSHLSVLQKHEQLSPLTDGIMKAAGYGKFLKSMDEML